MESIPEEVVVTESIGDGIVVDKVFIYYGDGIYAEQQPEKQRGTNGEGRNADNTVFKGQQKDNQGS